jgi:hypothetical protein
MEGSRCYVYGTEGHLPLGGKPEGLLPPIGNEARNETKQSRLRYSATVTDMALYLVFLPPSLPSLISIYSRPFWSDFPFPL